MICQFKHFSYKQRVVSNEILILISYGSVDFVTMESNFSWRVICIVRCSKIMESYVIHCLYTQSRKTLRKLFRVNALIFIFSFLAMHMFNT